MFRLLPKVFLAFLPVLLLMVPIVALAADPDSPHPHQGVLTAFEGAPPVPSLSQEDLKKLASGEPVLKHSREGEGEGRGIAVQDIQADPQTIWSKILDYPNYPDMVDGVHETEVYEQEDGRVKVRFVIGASLIRVEYFIDHRYDKDEGYMTWTLDYSRSSDLDDSVGFWRVQPLEDRPGWTRVFYSVQLRVGGWVPGWVENMLANRGLTDATAWVKRESEAAAASSDP